MEKETRERAE